MTQHRRRWTLHVDGIQVDTWYFVEATWDVHIGFQAFVDGVQRDELDYSAAETLSAAATGRRSRGRFLVGFADDPDVDGDTPVLYGDFIVDEVELWFQDRNTLLAFGYIDRG